MKHRGKRSHIAGILALGAILIVAAAIRLASIRFGLPALHDPDELMFELGAVKMLRETTLNPGWFGHPATTVMYALAALNTAIFLLGLAMGWFRDAADFGHAIYQDPSWVILPGRMMMTLFGLGTIALTWRLGTRLAGRRAGFIAAALLALSPLHVAYSQIIRSDMLATLFMLAAMLCAVSFAERGQRRDMVLAAIWSGLAIATKWPFALSFLAIAGAQFARWRDENATPRAAMLQLTLAGAITLVTLLAASPYLLLDYPTVLSNLHGEARTHHLGATGSGPIGNAWWYLSGALAKALGWAALALALSGLVLPQSRRLFLPLCGSVMIAFFILISFQHLVWERWALPMLPVAAVAAGIAGAALLRGARTRAGKAGMIALAGGGAAILAAPPLATSFREGRERLNDTRTLASDWARRHVPAGSTVMVEHFAFDLLRQPWRFIFPTGPAGCVDARALLQGKVRYASVEAMRQGRSNVDYGSVTAQGAPSCKADFAILTQYDRYAREAALFPREYAAYRRLLAAGDIVATIQPEPGRIGGRTVRIVRFTHTGATGR